ncbi:MAG: AAA family ATPase [Ignavibacteriales bacterium]|nr:MAG: AAA family ATPase [Ignavibacteriales bacterium]
MSNINIDQVIKEFNSLIENGKVKSINTGAQAIGISPARLNQFLNKNYKGNIQETAKIVNDWLALHREREETAIDDIPFVAGVTNSDLVIDLCRLCHVQKTIGLVIGRSGLCKTKALQKYASDHKDVIYIEVDAAYSTKELMVEIHERVGFNAKGHLNSLKKDIIKKLKNTGRTIIVDQFEYLPDKAIELLRTIHDKAGVGLVLAGLPRGLKLIRGIDGVHEQIYTRIGAAVELQPLKDSDIEKLTKVFIPGSNGEFKDFIEPSRRNARVLNILTREAQRIAKNKGIKINPDVIAKANRQLVS